MANWSNPTLTSLYTDFVTEVKNRDVDLALGLDPATTSPTNVPANAIRWNSASFKYQKWDGSTWNDLSTKYIFTAVEVSGSTVPVNGMYLSTTNTLNFSTASTASRLTIDGSGNVNIDSGTLYVDAAGNRTGVNNTSPGSYNAAADDLVVGLTGDTGVTIASTNQGSIFFADGTTGGAQQAAGYLYYLHSNDSMGFGTANTLRMTLDASGNLGLGVVPSAYWYTYKALQVGYAASLWANPSGGDVYFSANYYYGSSAGSATNTDRYLNNGAASYYRQNAGVHSWGIAGSGTAGAAITFTQAMTLVGTSAPALLVGTTTNLQSYSFQAPNQNGFAVQNSANSSNVAQFAGGGNVTLSAAGNFAVINGASGTLFGVGGNEQMRLDASGNLGLGVVPSAWGSGATGIQINTGASLYGSSVNVTLGANHYLNASGTYKYLVNAYAGAYYVNYGNTGSHVWLTAPSGTAGNPITFTQAMTLSAAGYLGLGGATSPGALLDISGSGNIVRLGDGTNTHDVRFKGPNNWSVQLNTSTDIFSVQRNSVAFVNIDGAGNLGIKNSSPTSYNAAADDLVVGLSGDTGMTIVSGTANQGSIFFADGTTGGAQQAAGYLYYLHSNDSMGFGTANTLRMTLDASGNLGLGVVPSAWGSNFAALQLKGAFGGGLSTSSASNTSTNLSHSVYHNGTSWVYGATGFGAARFEIDGPAGGATYKWFTAPSGTAGTTTSITNGRTYLVTTLGSTTLAQWQTYFSGLSALPSVGQTITATNTGTLAGGATVTEVVNFTQAMTLDASGRLLVGTTLALTGGVTQYGKFVLLGNTGDTTASSVLALGKGSAAANGDTLGQIYFTDNTAGQYAFIGAYADAATGAGDYPGRLVFSTTADGAASPTPRMQINNLGYMQGTVNGLGAGRIPAKQYYRLDSSFTGTNGTAAQPIYGVGVTLVGSTVYEFEAIYALARSSGSTSHTMSFLFGGTATINNIFYTGVGPGESGVPPLNTYDAAPTSFVANSAVASVATGAMTFTGGVFYLVKGTVSINAGGTFIPQYQLSAAPGGAYTTYAGAYFSIWPLAASGSAVNIGTWA